MHFVRVTNYIKKKNVNESRKWIYVWQNMINNGKNKMDQTLLFKHFNKQIKAWVLAQPAASKQPENICYNQISTAFDK